MLEKKQVYLLEWITTPEQSDAVVCQAAKSGISPPQEGSSAQPSLMETQQTQGGFIREIVTASCQHINLPLENAGKQEPQPR